VEVARRPVPTLSLVTYGNLGRINVLWRKEAPIAVRVLAEFASISQRGVNTGSVEKCIVVIILTSL
jgi:hypothetical protein